MRCLDAREHLFVLGGALALWGLWSVMHGVGLARHVCGDCERFSQYISRRFMSLS